jgi:DNA-binding response OmpR family regulator
MYVVSNKIYCFEGYTLDLRRGCLRCARNEIELRPKSFNLLRYLVENAGRLTRVRAKVDLDHVGGFQVNVMSPST